MPSKRPPPPSDSGDDQLAFDLPDDPVGKDLTSATRSPEASDPDLLVVSSDDSSEIVPSGPKAHPALASTSFGHDGTPLRLNHVGEMYGHWFLDYASYVILERAVPHLNDGLKPVQRRILHAMERMDDGRFNKVANIVGETMKYHPHGDSAITEALVGLGQKDLLVETQGNWGNILTGDEAAAGRYI